MQTIERDIVSALILSQDGKLLLGKKDPTKGGVYIDCWHLPGGGIEKGEEKQESLVREVVEEVGIDIHAYQIELIDDTDGATVEKTLPTGERVLCTMHFNVYKILLHDKLTDDVDVMLSDDLIKYEWFTQEQIEQIKLTPPGKKLFALFSEKIFFSS